MHDLAASKLAAGRGKDLDFVRVLLAGKLATAGALAERVTALPLPPERLELLRERLNRLSADGNKQ